MPNALIIGDSQAGGAGAKLAARLQADGYTVTRKWKDGGNGRDVAKLAHDQSGKPWSLVVVFHGGDDGGTWAVQQEVPALFPGASLVWYGSSPATRIASMATAKAVFGSKVKGPLQWFDDGTAAAREKRNQLMPGHLPAGVVYVDWRDLQLPGAVTQASGVAFPDLQDGIHVTGSIATAAFEAPNWPPPAAGATGQADQAGLLVLAVLLWLVLR